MKKKNDSKKAYNFDYDRSLEAMVLTIFDKDGMLPFYVRYSEAGIYKVIKTQTGKLQMTK